MDEGGLKMRMMSGGDQGITYWAGTLASTQHQSGASMCSVGFPATLILALSMEASSRGSLILALSWEKMASTQGL